MIGLCWGQGGIPKVTTMGPSRVSGTSSKFSKTKTVVALPWKVTDPCTTSVIHSCPEKDVAIFAENGVAGLCAAILSYYNFRVLDSNRGTFVSPTLNCHL